LSSVEQAFVGRDEKRAPLKAPVWVARYDTDNDKLLVVIDYSVSLKSILRASNSFFTSLPHYRH